MKMKQKNGFTLIELLAVIVIIAVVALIVIPVVGNIIEDARLKSYISSALNISNAAILKHHQHWAKNKNEQIEFYYSNGVETSNIPNLKLDYKGKRPESGKITVNTNGEVNFSLYNGTYLLTKDYENDEIKHYKMTPEEYANSKVQWQKYAIENFELPVQNPKYNTHLGFNYVHLIYSSLSLKRNNNYFIDIEYKDENNKIIKDSFSSRSYPLTISLDSGFGSILMDVISIIGKVTSAVDNKLLP